MATTPAAARPASRGGVFRFATRLFNPLAMRLAGTRIFPLNGVLEHRGRKSGKAFRTPVVVRAVQDGFIVPMPWGETTDWYRNVRAAGGATIRWKGRVYTLDRPEVLDMNAARTPFGGSQQAMMRRFGIRQVLHLRRVGTT
jgi:deazaflavin-dependent oxidoreductase (nitroreductase family)